MDLEFAKHFFEENWEVVSLAITCVLGFLLWRWLAGKKEDREQEKNNDQNMRCSHGVRTWRMCRKCAKEFEIENRENFLPGVPIADRRMFFKSTPSKKSWITEEYKKAIARETAQPAEFPYTYIPPGWDVLDSSSTQYPIQMVNGETHYRIETTVLIRKRPGA